MLVCLYPSAMHRVTDWVHLKFTFTDVYGWHGLNNFKLLSFAVNDACWFFASIDWCRFVAIYSLLYFWRKLSMFSRCGCVVVPWKWFHVHMLATFFANAAFISFLMTTPIHVKTSCGSPKSGWMTIRRIIMKKLVEDLAQM
jgi:hypothetical protein